MRCGLACEAAGHDRLRRDKKDGQKGQEARKNQHFVFLTRIQLRNKYSEGV